MECIFLYIVVFVLLVQNSSATTTTTTVPPETTTTTDEPAQQDCAGTWSACDPATCTETFSETQAASGGGAACAQADQATRECEDTNLCDSCVAGWCNPTPCFAGTTFSTSGNAPCDSCTTCGTDETATTTCTQTTDTVCDPTPCVAGSTFSTSGNAPCDSCTICGTDETATTTCTQTTDTVCVMSCQGEWVGTCDDYSCAQVYSVTAPADVGGAACEANDHDLRACVDQSQCDIDCIGDWVGDCNDHACQETFVVSVASANSGINCNFSDNDVRTCTNTDNCPTCSDDVMNGDELDVDCGGSCVSCDPNVDCQGAWICNYDTCEETYTVSVSQTGVGESCPFANAATRACTFGELCNIDCYGGWSGCDPNTCSQTFNVLTAAVNDGAACSAMDGETQECPDTNLCVDVNCVGYWSECDIETCYEHYTIALPQYGAGDPCAAVDGELRTCDDLHECDMYEPLCADACAAETAALVECYQSAQSLGVCADVVTDGECYHAYCPTLVADKNRCLIYACQDTYSISLVEYECTADTCGDDECIEGETYNTNLNMCDNQYDADTSVMVICEANNVLMMKTYTGLHCEGDPVSTEAVSTTCTAAGNEYTKTNLYGDCGGVDPNTLNDQDCIGSWSACVDCVETYTITTPAAWDGTDCSVADGAQQACGGDNCSATNPIPCVAGTTFSASGNAPCDTCATCGADETETTACTATTDTVCTTKKIELDNLGYFDDDQPATITGDVVLAFDGSTVTITYDLEGVSADCAEQGDAGNSCGIHIHATQDCSTSSAAGGHYFGSDIEDPWGTIVYTASNDGTATGKVTVDWGLTYNDALGASFVVHNYDGSRETCTYLDGSDERLDAPAATDPNIDENLEENTDSSSDAGTLWVVYALFPGLIICCLCLVLFLKRRKTGMSEDKVDDGFVPMEERRKRKIINGFQGNWICTAAGTGNQQLLVVEEELYGVCVLDGYPVTWAKLDPVYNDQDDIHIDHKGTVLLSDDRELPTSARIKTKAGQKSITWSLERRPGWVRSSGKIGVGIGGDRGLKAGGGREKIIEKQADKKQRIDPRILGDRERKQQRKKRGNKSYQEQQRDENREKSLEYLKSKNVYGKQRFTGSSLHNDV